MAEIFGVGLACIDHLMRMPKGGRPVEYLTQGGGLTGTALVAASRLGAETAICTKVGDDLIGRLIIDGLREEGVGTDHVFVVKGGRSPASLIHVDADTGERTIYFYPGEGLEVSVDRIPLEAIRSSKVLLVDAWWYEGALAAAKAAKEAGVKVVADMWVGEDTAELVGLVDVLIVGEGAGMRLAEGRGVEFALRRMAEMGPEIVAITMGERGCWFMAEGKVEHLPAFEVEAVDTTGAGDAFHGAFAFGLLEGWDLRRCFLFASAVGALNCRKLGGRSALPTYEEAIRFLEERGVGGWG